MRPLELKVRNFRSYFGDEAVFDFRNRRLIGIVGPIGAGKSSLLDAVSFALYSRTPRVARSTKSLIHQRADAAAVSLRFSVEDEIYEVVRSLRRKGQSQHALYRYESDTAGIEPAEKWTQEGDVNLKVSELLGFDFDAFGRSVMLAQGQFAEFLNAKPVERDKVLKGVFGHQKIDAMREVAKDKSRGAHHELEKVGIQLEAIRAAHARLKERRIELVAAEERMRLFEKAEARVVELVSLEKQQSERKAAAVKRLDELNELSGRLPDPTASADLVAGASSAAAARGEVAERMAKAHATLSTAEELFKSDEMTAKREALRAAGDLLTNARSYEREISLMTKQASARDERRRDLQSKHTELGVVLDAAERRLVELEAESALAVEAAEAAETDLLAARHADMAASLRSDLAEGDACPVCEQPVHAIPSVEAGDVAKIEAVAAQARQTRSDVETRLRSAAGDLKAAEAGLATSSKTLEELDAEAEKAAALAEAAEGGRADLFDQVSDLIGEGEPGQRVERLEKELEEAEANVEVARATVEEVRRAHDAAISLEQESVRALNDLRAALSAAAAKVDGAVDVPDGDPEALGEAVAELGSAWSDAVDAASGERDGAQATLEQIVNERAELFSELNVDDGFPEAFGAIRTRVEMLSREVAGDEEQVDAADGLQASYDREKTRSDSFARLAGDLTDSRFIRYLLDEERAALAELGSEHFQRLSSGRYRFTDDGDFHVVDLTAADAVRRPDSLSGGETFLASLALALGLAEMVSRTGGRLDSLFLDEGFGSLDPEHLDLAMEGIEALVGRDRLVVVVSHVPEMKQRLEDVIVLDRDPTTGDSVVVSA